MPQPGRTAKPPRRATHRQRQGGQDASARSSLEGVAVEVGVRIFEFVSLDGSPGGGGVRDVVAPAFRYHRAENTDHTTLAIEDERA